jgi:glycosyltransferase involved in cell wall biosynthesis
MVRFGYLGRLAPHKGVRDLLEAVRLLDVGGWTLTVGGTGAQGYEVQLRQRFEGGPVTFVGHTVADDFLRQIDVLIVPSRWDEPFGRVVVEAFARGVPVVGAAVGGIPELITPEETGWLFQPGNVRQLAAILQGIVGNWRQARRMGSIALAEANGYQQNAIASRYLRLYRLLLGTGSASPAISAKVVGDRPP